MAELVNGLTDAPKSADRDGERRPRRPSCRKVGYLPLLSSPRGLVAGGVELHRRGRAVTEEDPHFSLLVGQGALNRCAVRQGNREVQKLLFLLLRYKLR